MTTEQRQDSLTDQIATVRVLAVKAGCYDAVEWIDRKQKLERIGMRHTETAVDFLRSIPTERTERADD